MEVIPAPTTSGMPQGWHQVSLLEIAAKRANATVGGPFGSDLVAKDYVHSGVPVIRGQNMGRGFVSGEFVFVTAVKAKALQANLTKPLDLVFTQRGTLGQVALVPPAPFDEYVISQSQMKLTVDPMAADPVYIYQYFSSEFGQRQILDSAIQTGVPHTNLGILRGYKVPMPQLVEDQLVVATALTDADALIDSLEQLLTKKRQIKQGAMQELLTGKRRLPGCDKPWVNRLFDGIAATSQERVNPSALTSPPLCLELEQLESGTGCLSGGAFESQQAATKSVFRCGDVLFGKLRAYLRKYWLAEFDGVCSTEIWVLRPKGDLASSKYLFYTVQRDEFIEAASTAYGTHMPRSDWKIVSEFAVRVPRDPAEQEAIALVLADMDTDITALESRLTKARALKQAMAQALLTGRIRLTEGAAA